MTVRRRVVAIAALAAATLALGACAPAGPAAAGAGSGDDGATKITFMYSPYADYAGFFVAEEKGYFDEAGLDVELIPKGGSSGETFQHVSTGNVNGGGASWGAGLFNATAAGSSLAVIAGVSRVPDSGPNPAPLMASEASGIEDLKDLKGKKIGTPGQTGFGIYSIYKALDSVGLTLDDVELMNLSPGDIIPAMANGSIDASWTIEPISSALKQQGIAHEITDTSYHAGTELGMMLFNAKFADENEEAVVAFLAAYLKAARELKDGGWQDPEIKKIVAEYTELSVEALESIALTDVDLDGKIDWKSVAEQEAYMRELGVLEFSGESGIEKAYRDDIRTKAVEKANQTAKG